ncbi:MAG: hypothetical protein V4725_20310 [Bacteroidota bacterium]|nr:hypothetical protein [Ferruginibacter sp.]
MRYTVIFLLISLFAVSCGKDKYTTNPQISFKSVKPNALRSDLPTNNQTLPVLTIGITDAEGDIGFINGKDTAFVYIKSLINSSIDSFIMPDIQSLTGKNYEADLLIEPPFKRSSRPSPKVDTLYYEIYVKDFAKNKSNVIVTSDPVYYIVP